MVCDPQGFARRGGGWATLGIDDSEWNRCLALRALPRLVCYGLRLIVGLLCGGYPRSGLLLVLCIRGQFGGLEMNLHDLRLND